MKTELDWSEYRDAGMGDAYADIPKRGGDFAKAVAVCINSHQCERDGRGVMCPSHRVTGDPRLTPGGRVRLLKRALNDADDGVLCDDAELAQAMALCVGCKGCKRECENNVDMAQIKIEYLAQKHHLTPPSLRTRLFAHLPRWQHRLPWLNNLVVLRNRQPVLAWLGEKLFRISPRRLPEATAQPYSPTPSVSTSAAPAVVLFIDSFTRYFEPATAQAAEELLRTAGYRVIVAAQDKADKEADRPLCCGRSYLAHGLVSEARLEAQRVVTALAPYLADGLPIVGLEPACLLALRDDYRALHLGPVAEQLSRNAWLFEEFIARETQAGRMKLNFRPGEQTVPILVHGHCHQKAVGAMKSMRKVLSLLPDANVQYIEASCCGMGGSFGYEAEHAVLSLQMAEQALLPALRAQPEATVIANGYSCRQQIRDGAPQQPRHLALVLRERLVTAATPETPTD